MNALAPKVSYLRRCHKLQGVRLQSHASAPAGSLSPAQVLAGYGFRQNQFAGIPSDVIGIVSLGGGIVQGDIDAAVSAWGMLPPDLAIHPVGGATGDPTSDPDSNVENMLDLLILAFTWWYLTGTAAQIVFCVGPNATDGMTLVVDNLTRSGCGVISCSWGGPEVSWDMAERAGLSQKLAAAIAAGVTFLAASGDNSEDDGTRAPVVDYPCGDRNAWAVGGTSLVLASDGSIASESAWGDGQPGDEGGGGGIDASVPIPEWQRGVVPGSRRGAPDSSAVADPNTGWQVFANGAPMVVGGTSAAAPFTAGLVAVAKAKGGSTGLLTPRMYAQRGTAFHDITRGSNGAPAVVGWDPATGLGSPKGAEFMAALGTEAVSNPGPPQNPPQNPVLQPGSGPVTLAQAQAWASAGLDAGPLLTWRSQAKAFVLGSFARYWPKPAQASNSEPCVPDPARVPDTLRPDAPAVIRGIGTVVTAPKAAADVVLVGYVGPGVEIRGVGGQGVEITVAGDPNEGDGARLVGWNRPGGTITDMLKAAGKILASGSR